MIFNANESCRCILFIQEVFYPPQKFFTPLFWIWKFFIISDFVKFQVLIISKIWVGWSYQRFGMSFGTKLTFWKCWFDPPTPSAKTIEIRKKSFLAYFRLRPKNFFFGSRFFWLRMLGGRTNIFSRSVWSPMTSQIAGMTILPIFWK